MESVDDIIRSIEAMGMASGFNQRVQTDRQSVIATFRAQRAFHAMANLQNMHQLRITHLDDPPAPSGAALFSLRPILISELRAGTRHQGRVLYGKLIEDAFRMTAVITILEDEAGEVTLLTVYRALRSNAHERMVGKLFPKGQRIAVKEPHFKVAQDGRLVVRVDNPDDIVRLHEDVLHAAPSTGQGQQASTRGTRGGRAGSSGEGTLRLVEELRGEGRKFCIAGEWAKAVQTYGRLISVIEESEEERRDHEWLKEDYVIAYSNRAEGWLKVEKYEEALGDTVKALERDAGHVKSIARKVRALCGLEIFHEALPLLQEVMKNRNLDAPNRMELDRMLRDVEEGYKQRRLGQYDLNQYYASGERGGAPKCRDFVGPVEIRLAEQEGGSMGRGLFVTSGVKPGDLLLVSNPLAVAKGTEGQAGLMIPTPDGTKNTMYTMIHEDVLTELVDLCRRFPRCLRQVYSLSDGTEGSHSEVPPMSLFLPPPDSSNVVPPSATEEIVDIARIRRIQTVNSFSDHGNVDALRRDESQVTSPSGLWVLPSFINHSCLPNAHWSFVGDVMFVRAAHDIQSGEQITISYCELQEPLVIRRAFFEAHSGFECRCPRCTFEQKLLDKFPALITLTQQFTDLLPRHKTHDDEATKRLSAAGVKIADQLEQILRQFPAVDADRKDWIRYSYGRTFMCVASEHLRRVLQNGEWSSFVEHIYSMLNMMFRIHATEQVFAEVSGVHRLMMEMYKDYRKTWMAKWTQLLKQICNVIYGPLRKDAMKAVVDRHARKPLPL